MFCMDESKRNSHHGISIKAGNPPELVKGWPDPEANEEGNDGQKQEEENTNLKIKQSLYLLNNNIRPFKKKRKRERDFFSLEIAIY